MLLVLMLLLIHCAANAYFSENMGDFTEGERRESPLTSENENVPKNSQVDQSDIVMIHNFFRAKVSPTATNMLKMSWHDEAASQAQAYAEECKFLKHNDGNEREVFMLGTCGQNIYVSTDNKSWFDAIQQWYNEEKDFTYGTQNSFEVVGHYTQMVWATSHSVGCGLASCIGGDWGHFYNYVCHYCPSGNINGIIDFPYKVGPSCNDCPKDCVANKLCTNACRYKDYYNNCNELVNYDGICEAGTCNATCNCGDSLLYKNYPW